MLTFEYNRIEVSPQVASALLRHRHALPEPRLREGLLRPEIAEEYQRVVQSLPGVDTVLDAAASMLTFPSGDGYLVVGCRTVLDECELDEALRLVTAVLTLIGTPLRVFDRWPLWKPLTSKLDVDPMRAFGIGYNPLHLDLVNTTCPPDYSVLLCVRPDPRGGGFSVVSNVRRALGRLDADTVALLGETVYRDGAFFDLTGVGEEYDPFPIVDGHPVTEGFVRFTAKMLADRDPDDPHTRAARALEEELIAGQRRFRLERGDLLIVNQHLACHGREALGPGQGEIPEEARREVRQIFLRAETGAGEGSR